MRGDGGGAALDVPVRHAPGGSHAHARAARSSHASSAASGAYVPAEPSSRRRPPVDERRRAAADARRRARRTVTAARQTPGRAFEDYPRRRGSAPPSASACARRRWRADARARKPPSAGSDASCVIRVQHRQAGRERPRPAATAPCRNVYAAEPFARGVAARSYDTSAPRCAIGHRRPRQWRARLGGAAARGGRRASRARAGWRPPPPRAPRARADGDAPASVPFPSQQQPPRAARRCLREVRLRADVRAAVVRDAAPVEHPPAAAAAPPAPRRPEQPPPPEAARAAAPPGPPRRRRLRRRRPRTWRERAMSREARGGARRDQAQRPRADGAAPRRAIVAHPVDQARASGYRAARPRRSRAQSAAPRARGTTPWDTSCAVTAWIRHQAARVDMRAAAARAAARRGWAAAAGGGGGGGQCGRRRRRRRRRTTTTAARRRLFGGGAEAAPPPPRWQRRLCAVAGESRLDVEPRSESLSLLLTCPRCIRRAATRRAYTARIARDRERVEDWFTSGTAPPAVAAEQRRRARRPARCWRRPSPRRASAAARSTSSPSGGKLMRCGVCEGCLVEHDCGLCGAASTNIKFGGANSALRRAPRLNTTSAASPKPAAAAKAVAGAGHGAGGAVPSRPARAQAHGAPPPPPPRKGKVGRAAEPREPREHGRVGRVERERPRVRKLSLRGPSRERAIVRDCRSGGATRAVLGPDVARRPGARSTPTTDRRLAAPPRAQAAVRRSSAARTRATGSSAAEPRPRAGKGAHRWRRPPRREQDPRTRSSRSDAAASPRKWMPSVSPTPSSSR